LLDAERTFNAKGKLTPDAVSAIKSAVDYLYKSELKSYSYIRNENIKKLEAKGISKEDAESSLNDYSQMAGGLEQKVTAAGFDYQKMKDAGFSDNDIENALNQAQ
jgi:hypothetical protein